MKRAALALTLAACFTSKPAPKTSPIVGGSGSASPPADYPPAQFKPPTTGLAVGIATFLIIDDVGERVFVRKDNGIDVLALDSGKKIGHADLKPGELYPADKKLLSLLFDGTALAVTMIDPSGRVDATCNASVKMPAGAIISRVDVFTTHAGKTFLKWEGSAPSPPHGGAALSDDEIAEMSKNFQSTYACGLLEVDQRTGCTLVPSTYQAAGLESCETRMMPWPRYLPTPIGSLSMSTERSSTQRNYLYIDIETFIVKDGSGERWRLPIETRATPPAPP